MTAIALTAKLDMASARQTLRDALIAQLRDDILTGQLPPGARLRQQDVAARFDVSTTPVREAFAALEREGLVRSEAHRGVVVFEPTAEYLREIYDIRLALESLAVRKAAENVTDEQLAQLQSLIEQMAGVLNDRDAYHSLNARFHDLVYAASGSPRLVELIRQLRDSVNAYLRLYARHVDSADIVHEDHVRIARAMERRDADAAVSALEQHLRRTVDYVSDHLPVATQLNR